MARKLVVEIIGDASSFNKALDSSTSRSSAFGSSLGRIAKGAAFAAPDESDTTFMRLEAGRYGGACFIPQGTTHDTEGSGPPHFTLGMFAEFTVE